MKTILKEGQFLKHKKSSRLIKVIAVQGFKNIETRKEELFCSYYWSEFGLIGTDLVENIKRDYEVFKDI